ncbi:unnamed protein product [Camellia sinensis]
MILRLIREIIVASVFGIGSVATAFKLLQAATLSCKYGGWITASINFPEGLQSPLPPTFQGTGLEFASPLSSVFVQAPAEKGFRSFMIDLLMGGVSAAVSKTAAAPIERAKLLIQNQDEMIKAGRLPEPYKGISDCFARTIKDEGIIALWRSNTTNVIIYFPTQYGSSYLRSLKHLFHNPASHMMGQPHTRMVTRSGSPGIWHYARTRLANDATAAKNGGGRQFNGLIDVCSLITNPIIG